MSPTEAPNLMVPAAGTVATDPRTGPFATASGDPLDLVARCARESVHRRTAYCRHADIYCPLTLDNADWY